MKIAIDIDPSVKDTEISISCSQLTPEIEKILATLRILNQQLMVTKNEETHLLDVSKIIYIEAVERKTFVYTKEEFYESKLKLYEMEERLLDFPPLYHNSILPPQIFSTIFFSYHSFDGRLLWWACFNRV